MAVALTRAPAHAGSYAVTGGCGGNWVPYIEQRTDKRPLVADIAGWDPVVARPDLVLLLYRHDLYFPADEREDELDIIVAKNRQGPVGVATVALRPRYCAIAPDGDAS